MTATEDFGNWRAKVESEISEFKRDFVHFLFNQIVDRTPVDTGYARANWRLGETLPFFSPPSKGPEGMTFGLPSFPQISGKEDVLFIFNPLPYITALEEGHSSQSSPGNMVAGSIALALATFGE